ncbi:MAG: gliding motility-associated C-terminal domain-containing protein, partial [Bacteroidota bacterium]|nr:gliding motility-associated C-terminal domain-containing protein [Bacteroidota bacterium]
TYTVTGTDGNGCVNTDQVDVVVNALPLVDAGVDQAVCIGSGVVLAGSGAQSYSWDNGVTDGVSFTGTILGATTYTVTGTDGNGCVNTDQVDVVVNALPVVDAGVDQAVCDGFAVLLAGSGAQSYSWDNGVVDGSAFTPPLGTTTYTVTGTDGNGCVNTDQMDVVVNSQVNINMINDSIICFGDTINLFANTSGMLVEQFTMTFGSPFSYSTINTFLPGSYYVKISGTFTTTGFPLNRDGAYNFGNNPPTQTYEWKWNGQNPATQTQTNPAFSTSNLYALDFTGGASQTFTFSENTNAPGYNPIWWNDNFGSLNFEIYYLGNILWSNGDTSSVSTVSPNQSINYSVSIDYGSGCSSNGTVDVIVSNPLHTESVTNANCNFPDGEINLLVNNGIPQYQYSIDSGLSFQNSGLFSNLYAGSYQIIVEDSVGCQSTSTLIIDAIPGPTIDFINASDELCYGDCLGSIEILSPNAVLYSIDNLPFQPSNLFDTLCSGVYMVYAQNSVGCITEDSVEIISPPPISLSVPNDTIICQGSSIQLDAICQGGVGGYVYHWNNGSISQSVNVSPTSFQNYCVNVSDANGCETNQLCIGVDLHPPLVAFSSNDTLICDGDSAFLGAVVISGDGGPYNFNWNQGLGNNQNNYVNPSSTTTYNVNISDGCETISLNTTVTVSPIPIISFTASNLDGCLPVEVTLFDLNVPPGAQCFWDFGDGGNSSSCDSVSYLFSNPGCWDVSLNVTTPDGCFATHSESQYVCVYEYPNSTFSFSPNPTTLLNTEINFDNYSTDAVDYLWTFDVNGTPSFSNDENPTFIFSDEQEAEYLVCLDAISSNGCIDVSCQTIEITDVFLVYVPNAFSPGGDDNINDIFIPVVNGASVKNFDFYIFNRWGEMIFESHHQTEGWDGYYKGKLAKQDAYVWKLSLVDEETNKLHQYTGSVLLLGRK